MSIAIIIPARYGSTRFPGKPLVKIAGKTMLERVVEIGKRAQQSYPNIRLAVATEDERIANHCADIDVECVLTSDKCATGSDRILEAAKTLGQFDYVLGLQGDAPFTPLDAMTKIIENFSPDIDVLTPTIQLRWEELDALRDSKHTTPFSGTTCIRDPNGRALWFSKNILPAIRKEDRSQPYSPVFQHLGLYGYRMEVLERFVNLPQSHYEKLEGLEQLRLLENGISIDTIVIDVEAGLAQAGIDSPEDIERAEKILSQ